MAGVLRLEPRERFAFLLDDPGELQEELAAVLRGECAPRALERRAGGVDGGLGVGFTGQGDFREDLVRMRIEDGERRPGFGRAELAIDEETAKSEERRVGKGGR